MGQLSLASLIHYLYHISFLLLREGFNKKTLKVIEFSILGGEGLPVFQNFFREKKCFFHKKYKYDQNGLIHPEK